MLCYVCHDTTTQRSPCTCAAPVHARCLALAQRKGFSHCGICLDELPVFQWTPVYLRRRRSSGSEWAEEFWRTPLYLALLTGLTGNVLRAALLGYSIVLCTRVCLYCRE